MLPYFQGLGDVALAGVALGGMADLRGFLAEVGLVEGPNAALLVVVVGTFCIRAMQEDRCCCACNTASQVSTTFTIADGYLLGLACCESTHMTACQGHVREDSVAMTQSLFKSVWVQL